MNIRELEHWRGVIEHRKRIIEQLEHLQFTEGVLWAGVSLLPDGVHEKSDQLRAAIEEHRRAIADAQAALAPYCEPLLRLVGEQLHDAIQHHYPITSKTALIEVQRDLIHQYTYYHAVPRQCQLSVDEPISPFAPPPDILPIHGGLFAESRDSRRWWVGYDASIDTVFVA